MHRAILEAKPSISALDRERAYKLHLEALERIRNSSVRKSDYSHIQAAAKGSLELSKKRSTSVSNSTSCSPSKNRSLDESGLGGAEAHSTSKIADGGSPSGSRLSSSRRAASLQASQLSEGRRLAECADLSTQRFIENECPLQTQDEFRWYQIDHVYQVVKNSSYLRTVPMSYILQNGLVSGGKRSHRRGESSEGSDLLSPSRRNKNARGGRHDGDNSLDGSKSSLDVLDLNSTSPVKGNGRNGMHGDEGDSTLLSGDLDLGDPNETGNFHGDGLENGSNLGSPLSRKGGKDASGIAGGKSGSKLSGKGTSRKGTARIFNMYQNSTKPYEDYLRRNEAMLRRSKGSGKSKKDHPDDESKLASELLSEDVEQADQQADADENAQVMEEEDQDAVELAQDADVFEQSFDEEAHNPDDDALQNDENMQNEDEEARRLAMMKNNDDVEVVGKSGCCSVCRI